MKRSDITPFLSILFMVICLYLYYYLYAVPVCFFKGHNWTNGSMDVKKGILTWKHCQRCDQSHTWLNGKKYG